MNNFAKLSFAFLLAAFSAFGQATLRSTNFSVAVSPADQFVFVASATGIEVGDVLFADREAMKVIAISGSRLNVRRGYEGPPSSHDTTTRIFVDDPSYFALVDKGGSCTASAERVLPVVNIRSAKIFNCLDSVWHAERVEDQFRPRTSVTTDATAGALTYTAAMLKGGHILRDPAGAGRSDVTPTAALLIASIPGAKVGDSFEFTIKNTADAAETITVTAGTGATLDGTMTIAQNNSKRFKVVITSLSAYTVYSLGTVVH